MGFSLFFNIIAVIISTAASIVLIIITVAMNEFTGDYNSQCQTIDDQCVCTYDDHRSQYETNTITCK